MNAHQNLQLLMSELSSSMPGISSVKEANDGGSWWDIELGHDGAVIAELDAPRDELVIVMDLPVPAEHRRLYMLEALMTRNFLSSEHLPIRMALDQPGGQVVQIAELPVEGLTLARLSQALSHFVEHARPWREALERDAEDDDEEQEPSAFHSLGLIRG